MPRDSKIEIIVYLRDKITAGLKSIGNGLKKAVSAVFSLKGALASLGIGLLAKSFLAAGVAVEKLNLTLQAATGSVQKAGEATQFLREESKRMGLVFQDQVGTFSQVAAAAQGTALEGQATKDVWVALAEVSTVLQLSAEDTRGAMTALTQIISKGKLSAEELRQQLGERLPGAFQIAARAMGVTTQRLDQMLANGEIMSEEFIPKFSAALRERFGPDVEQASQSWQANINRMTNVWFEFRAAVMNSGLFNYLKAALDEIVKIFSKAESDGTLTNWAVEISNGAIKAINFLAKLGAALLEVYHFGKRAFEGLKAVINIVLREMFAGLAALVNKLANVADKLGADKLANKLRVISENLKFASDTSGEEFEKAVDKVNKLAGEQGKYWNTTVEFLDKVKKKADDIKKAADNASKAQERQKPPSIVETLSELDKQKSAVSRLKADADAAEEILKSLYDQGIKTLDDYYIERKAIIEKATAAEISLLKAQAANETDLKAKQQYLDKAYKLEQEQAKKLAALDKEIYSEKEKLLQDQAEKEAIFRELRFAASTTGSKDEMLKGFEEELFALDEKHREEIEKLKDLKATEGEIEEAYRLQKLEKDKAMLEQEKQLNDRRIEMAKSASASLADIFSDLYTLTGEKTKEFFYLAKAAAMAEAIINTSQAITKALAQGGYWGIAQAALIGAKGAIEITKISSQGLAGGGMVEGTSPNPRADDKLIAATSGEFMIDNPGVKKLVKNFGWPFMKDLQHGNLNPKSFIRRFSMPPMAGGFGFAEGGLIGARSGMVTPGQGSSEGNQVNIVNFTDLGEFERFLATDRGQRSIVNAISNQSGTVRRVLQR